MAPVSRAALARLQHLAVVNLNDAGDVVETDPRVRKESRGLLYGFAEYHLERRMRSLPMLARSRAVSSFLPDIDPDKVPAHVAIVMDGNGRWATQRGLQRTDGHAAGEEALADTVEGGVEVGLKWLTVYAFSTENWRRPAGEVLYLMNFNRTLLRRRRDRFHELNVRIRFTGRRDWRVPRSVLREIVAAEEMTRDNTGMTLTIAFNYGGRVEIVDAVKQIVRDHDAGQAPDREDLGRLDPRAAVLPGHAGSGPVDPDERRATDLELPAVGGRVRGALVHPGVLAGLRPRAPRTRRSATSRSARAASATSTTTDRPVSPAIAGSQLARRFCGLRVAGRAGSMEVTPAAASSDRERGASS